MSYEPGETDIHVENEICLEKLSPEIREKLQILNKGIGTLPNKWVIFENDVYDIEGYLKSEEHPGGNLILEQSLYQDITDQFESIGHSTLARRLLLSFRAKNRKRSDGNSDIACEKQASQSKGLSLIDLNCPIVPQIFKLSKDEYTLVTSDYICGHTVYTFFSSPLLEVLSRTVWWVVPLVWIPVAGLLGYIAHDYYKISYAESVGRFLLGLFFWTFFEYLIHRFIFHFPEKLLFDSHLVRLFHFLVHGVHHTFPMDPLRLVVPPALFVILAIPLYFLSLLLFTYRFVHTVMPGVLVGYVTYDLTHYSTHHCTNIEQYKILNFLKTYHMRHHFKSPNRGFGVSTPLWDYVFRTQL